MDRSTRLDGRLIGGRYRVEHVVSRGANTIVTEAIDTESDRPVTVKIVQPDRAVTSTFRADFEDRVEIARSLAHPNIAAVLDAGEVELDGEPTCYWVVEYLGGGSLRDIFDRGRLLEPSQALVVGLEACRALEAAHARGVVHTEITPSKLVFGVDGRLRIVDFSFAELLGSDAWGEPATVPTHVARYASPEQALSQHVDAKTDVYALSLCLVQSITGAVPFAGESTVSTLAARVGKLVPVTADMGSMAAVLERGGRPDPEDRWTAAEFGQALVQAAEALPRPEPVPILASSLFAAGLAARAAAANAGPATPGSVDAAPGAGVDPIAEPAHEVAEAGPDAVPTPVVDDALAEHTSSEYTSAEHASSGSDTDPSPPADGVAPVIVLGADAPASTPDVAPAPAAHPPTVEMPASVAAAAAVATTPDTAASRAVVDPTPYDAEREGRKWGKYIAFAVVGIVGLVALGIAAFLLLRTKSYEVPDLVGVDEAVAINEISGNGWVLEQERERSDEVREVDHVVRTEPPAGEMLDEGETFLLVVSDGPLLRTLPDFAGEPIDDVRTTVDDMELVLAEGEPVFSETIPAGSVVSWSVQGDSSLVAGAQVLPGTVIDVVVSKGPEPRPAPDLTNMTPEEATAALENLQLVYAAGDDVFSTDIEPGRVAAQVPAPTTAVERGGTVTVQLSKGPELVPIPDLTGMSYPDAVTTLEDAGFVVNSLLGTTQGTFVSIAVDGSEVSVGDTFPRGTGVDLVFL